MIKQKEEYANVLNVAQYVFEYLKAKEISTYMKLQKIVYYSEVECLMHYKDSLFKEKILAYRSGPVVEELFYKHQGVKFFTNKIAFGKSSDLTIEQRTCANWALKKYGDYSGDHLSRLTHTEDPWKKAREGLSPHEPGREEITRKSMIEYYSKWWDEDFDDIEN